MPSEAVARSSSASCTRSTCRGVHWRDRRGGGGCRRRRRLRRRERPLGVGQLLVRLGEVIVRLGDVLGARLDGLAGSARSSPAVFRSPTVVSAVENTFRTGRSPRCTAAPRRRTPCWRPRRADSASATASSAEATRPSAAATGSPFPSSSSPQAARSRTATIAPASRRSRLLLVMLDICTLRSSGSGPLDGSSFLDP